MDVDEAADGSERKQASTSLLSPTYFTAFADRRPAPELERATVSSRQDLLAAFNLTSVYEEFVQPFVQPHSASPTKDKGKGKATDGDGAENQRRKLPKGYSSLVNDLPGRYNNFHRDMYFRGLAENPDFQDLEVQIDALDDQIKHDAFALEPGGIAEDLDVILGITQTQTQVKKKRKKRKKDELDAGGHSLAASTNATPLSNSQNTGDPSKKKRKKEIP